jgi:hypothetical protein
MMGSKKATVSLNILGLLQYTLSKYVVRILPHTHNILYSNRRVMISCRILGREFICFSPENLLMSSRSTKAHRAQNLHREVF